VYLPARGLSSGIQRMLSSRSQQAGRAEVTRWCKLIKLVREDSGHCEVRLDVGTTKNGEACVFPCARVKLPTVSGAVCTDILHLPGRVVVTAADRLTLADSAQCPGGVEWCQRTADDHPHDDRAAPSAALRPPASGSRPGHRGRDRRHGSRGPTLDGPWVARQGTEGRGKPGRDDPEGIGTPVRSPGAPATREEADNTPSARPRPTSNLGIHVDARAFARRTRQDQDAASRGARP
jgi:hypothetical protein